MTHYDIAKKLLGPIGPVGETNADRERLKNLNETIELVDRLVFDLVGLKANFKHREEQSMRAIGKRAAEYLEDLRIALEP